MSAEWIAIEIFINIIEFSALFYLLCNKFTSKYRTFIPIMLFVIGNIIFISLPIFISFPNLPIIDILVPLDVFLYLLFFRNGSNLKKIFWILISFAMLYSIALFSITIISIVSKVNSLHLITKSSTERLFTVVIAKTLQVVIFYILSKQKKDAESKKVLSPIPMLVCFSVPFISILFLLFIYILILRGFNVPDELLFIISLSYFIINIIVFILYEFMSREAEKNYILMTKHKQYELTKQHNSEIIEVYSKMREWRHDYANHMQLILSFLEKSDKADFNISKAINYIKDLDENIKSSSLSVSTGNYIVDAIVSAKETLALSYNINFEYNTYLPNAITVTDTDLCSILSNLFDNAIEACCKIEDNRYIHFEMITVKNQLTIKVSNSTNGEYKIENDRFKTTKRGDLHGIGMSHIKSIVNDYSGLYNIKAEDSSFTTQISLPLSKK